MQAFLTCGVALKRRFAEIWFGKKRFSEDYTESISLKCL